MSSSLVSFIEAPGLVGELLRALRQGFFFGLETRVPYAVAGILRPHLFGKEVRPWKAQLAFFAEQTLQHGWIIARISFLFKLFHAVLVKMSGSVEQQWHAFAAGALAGYLVMVRDGSQATLKTQINMAIGIRTIYALGSYLVRNDMVPGLRAPGGYQTGAMLYVTLMWGAVMWHWKHMTKVAPGEMMKGQIQQMDFIYTHGDAPGMEKWVGNNYVLWGLACLYASRLLK